MDRCGELIVVASEDPCSADFEPEFEDGEPDQAPRYADVRDLDDSHIRAALQSLTLFSDPYLRMQACNLAIVDGYLNSPLPKSIFRDGAQPGPADMMISSTPASAATWPTRAKISAFSV